RCVVWPTIRRPAQDGVSYAAMNRVLTTAAAGASNMRALDSSTIPGLGDDGVHYTPSGYRARAEKIAAAADECVGSLMLPGSGDAGGCADDSNLAVSAGGAAELQRAVTLRTPRAFKGLPLDLVAGGFGFQQVDARIYPDAVYILRTYNLRVTAARASGHSTHGDGTALDIVPAGDLSSQAVWDASAGKLATDLGWKPGACARNGRKPVCAFIPAIIAVFYDDFPNHGSPRTCQGRCPQHIHVSWESDTFGTSGLGPPPGFVKVFPVPSGFDDGASSSS
ncbi:MAG: hypothetical protein LC798_11755, partial [Chloroflexi bacterium]|nr:hypothetical protein [Chloroflexota bacterium]